MRISNFESGATDSASLGSLHGLRILFVVVIGAAPSIGNGIIAGVDQIPPIHLRVARVLGAKRLGLVRHVIMPAALPGVIAGLKQGWAFAWRSLMAGELLVIVAKVQVRIDRGVIVVVIPVSCDQTPEAAIEVGFAVGDDSRPAGMLAVAEDRPRGPAAVVDLWGDALTGFAWQVVLSVTTGVANATGEDVDRAPLVPAAITASPNGLRVLTMARHTFDRVR